MKLQGKIAVVTGAARGIGRATAERLRAEGARLVLADIDIETLHATAKAIGGADDVVALRVDVANKREVDGLVDAAVAKFGRIDIMVNNAGIAPVAGFLDVTEEMLDRVLAVNLKGAFYGTQAAARQMIALGGGGVIVNMSSINSGLANPNVAPSNVQLQLCEPGSDPSPQRRHLEEKGEGVFHVGFEVADADAAENQAKAGGLQVLMRGRRENGTGFTYYDTAQAGGVTLLTRATNKAPER